MRSLDLPWKWFWLLALLTVGLGLTPSGARASGRAGVATDGLVPDAAIDQLLLAAERRLSSPADDFSVLIADRRLLVAEQRISIRDDFDPTEAEVPEALIADPLESINRAFFLFNDKLYFWVLKPLATGYQKIFPEPLRVGFRNAFTNLATPVRVVNCLLQGDLKGMGTELLRFLVNSTMGVLGFGDAAKEVFEIERRDEDFGQTLGVYGLGPGFYICWPVLGPSSLRDTFGFAGDAFLDPVNYLLSPTKYRVGVKTYDRVNATSLTLGDYESLKKAAVDPYVAVRDAFHQYRQNKIKTRPVLSIEQDSGEL